MDKLKADQQQRKAELEKLQASLDTWMERSKSYSVNVGASVLGEEAIVVPRHPRLPSQAMPLRCNPGWVADLKSVGESNRVVCQLTSAIGEEKLTTIYSFELAK
ncbi:unnamed protein product [Linum trigynum]|uniref:Uncharacterized protein n=1 Tax=Linum trigynum TaxID=586398 RepID=A0AAV2ERQ2_9ROSI